MKTPSLTEQAAHVERMLTPRQVQERLSVSRATCWRILNERGLRVLRSQGVVRIREADLLAWIEKHSSGSNGNGSGADGF